MPTLTMHPDMYTHMYMHSDCPHTHNHTHTLTPLPTHTLTHSHTEMIERRREVVEKLHEFEQTIDPIVQLFEDPEVQLGMH